MIWLMKSFVRHSRWLALCYGILAQSTPVSAWLFGQIPARSKLTRWRYLPNITDKEFAYFNFTDELTGNSYKAAIALTFGSEYDHTTDPADLDYLTYDWCMQFMNASNAFIDDARVIDPPCHANQLVDLLGQTQAVVPVSNANRSDFLSYNLINNTVCDYYTFLVSGNYSGSFFSDSAKIINDAYPAYCYHMPLVNLPFQSIFALGCYGLYGILLTALYRNFNLQQKKGVGKAALFWLYLLPVLSGLSDVMLRMMTAYFMHYVLFFGQNYNIYVDKIHRGWVLWVVPGVGILEYVSNIAPLISTGFPARNSPCRNHWVVIRFVWSILLDAILLGLEVFLVTYNLVKNFLKDEYELEGAATTAVFMSILAVLKTIYKRFPHKEHALENSKQRCLRLIPPLMLFTNSILSAAVLKEFVHEVVDITEPKGVWQFLDFIGFVCLAALVGLMEHLSARSTLIKVAFAAFDEFIAGVAFFYPPLMVMKLENVSLANLIYNSDQHDDILIYWAVSFAMVRAFDSIRKDAAGRYYQLKEEWDIAKNPGRFHTLWFRTILGGQYANVACLSNGPSATQNSTQNNLKNQALQDVVSFSDDSDAEDNVVSAPVALASTAVSHNGAHDAIDESEIYCAGGIVVVAFTYYAVLFGFSLESVLSCVEGDFNLSEKSPRECYEYFPGKPELDALAESGILLFLTLLVAALVGNLILGGLPLIRFLTVASIFLASSIFSLTISTRASLRWMQLLEAKKRDSLGGSSDFDCSLEQLERTSEVHSIMAGVSIVLLISSGLYFLRKCQMRKAQRKLDIVSANGLGASLLSSEHKVGGQTLDELRSSSSVEHISVVGNSSARRNSNSVIVDMGNIAAPGSGHMRADADSVASSGAASNHIAAMSVDSTTDSDSEYTSAMSGEVTPSGAALNHMAVVSVDSTTDSDSEYTSVKSGETTPSSESSNSSEPGSPLTVVIYRQPEVTAISPR